MVDKEILGLVFSEHLTFTEELEWKFTPLEIDNFQKSKIGRWLIANMIEMQRQAAIDVLSGTRLVVIQTATGPQYDTEIMTESETNLARGQYLALNNILTLIKIAKEADHAEQKEE